MSRPRSARQRGQSLVEFALVIPIALILLIAVFDAGRAVFAYNALTNAAREGARLAVVNQDTSLVEQRVQNVAFVSGVSNVGTPGDPVVTFHETTPSTDPKANATCSPMATGCMAVVIVRGNWTAITPIIGSILGPLTFSARAELPVEFVCPNASIPAYATSASCPEQP